MLSESRLTFVGEWGFLWDDEYDEDGVSWFYLFRLPTWGWLLLDVKRVWKPHHLLLLHCQLYGKCREAILTQNRWFFTQCWLGWVGVNYGYWIIDPHLGTFLWPPKSVYALWLHIRKSYSREKKPSTISCVQASSHRLERPLQYFYQGCPGWSTPDYNIQVGTVFTLIHKNLGKVPKKVIKTTESARKVPKKGVSAWKST